MAAQSSARDAANHRNLLEKEISMLKQMQNNLEDQMTRTENVFK